MAKRKIGSHYNLHFIGLCLFQSTDVGYLQSGKNMSIIAFLISGSVQRKEIDLLLKYYYEKQDKISYHGSLQTIVPVQIVHNGESTR